MQTWDWIRLSIHVQPCRHREACRRPWCGCGRRWRTRTSAKSPQATSSGPSSNLQTSWENGGVGWRRQHLRIRTNELIAQHGRLSQFNIIVNYDFVHVKQKEGRGCCEFSSLAWGLCVEFMLSVSEWLLCRYSNLPPTVKNMPTKLECLSLCVALRLNWWHVTGRRTAFTLKQQE